MEIIGLIAVVLVGWLAASVPLGMVVGRLLARSAPLADANVISGAPPAIPIVPRVTVLASASAMTAEGAITAV